MSPAFEIVEARFMSIELESLEIVLIFQEHREFHCLSMSGTQSHQDEGATPICRQPRRCNVSEAAKALLRMSRYRLIL